MSGPIVRTGTTPAFWENWDNVFGKKAAKKKPAASAKSSTATKPKSAKPKAAKPARKKK